LADVMLGDAAKIQEEDAAYLNRHREKGEPPVEPLYTARDVYRTLLKLRPVQYDTPVEIGPGIEATFVEAGHLLGSAMIPVRIVPAFAVGRTQTIVYFLHQLIRAGRLPEIPIYVDSPMAAKATEVFQAHAECFDADTLQLLQHHPELFGAGRVRYIEKVHDSI